MSAPYYLTRKLLGVVYYWCVPKKGIGRWTLNQAKAKQYQSERSVHLAWTRLHMRYSKMRFTVTPVNEELIYA